MVFVVQYRTNIVAVEDTHGAYGVMATQHTVDVLLWVRNPLGSPTKDLEFSGSFDFKISTGLGKRTGAE
jgi:hypothetical protein